MGCVEIEVTRVPIEEIQTMIQERKKLHENFLSMWEPFKAGAIDSDEPVFTEMVALIEDFDKTAQSVAEISDDFLEFVKKEGTTDEEYVNTSRRFAFSFMMASRKNEEIAKLLFLCWDKLCEQ